MEYPVAQMVEKRGALLAASMDVSWVAWLGNVMDGKWVS